MGHRRIATWLVTAAAALSGAGVAAAQSDPSATARLEGTFSVAGKITVAVHISGERVGQRVQRTWTFTPLCPTGGCAQVELVRQRPSGTDSVVLGLLSTDRYVGRGRFFAALTCGGRRHARGVSVPFTISVRITKTRLVSGVAVATELQASYVNPRRVNRTRCVAIPGHDAARYTGSLA
ncbi:MAG TPA: hypothetical protein VGI87_11420 [Solirubrobacteraceae bacterium]|jgi:hypothetical protein